MAKKEVMAHGKLLVVDDRGNVWNPSTGKKLVPSKNKRTGYLSVAVWSKAKKRNKPVFIHRLVAEAFIPNPLNLPQVNHKNHIRYDNRAENLEWVSRKKNNSTKHSRRLRSINFKSVRHPNQFVRATKDGETRWFPNANQASIGLGCSEPAVVRALNAPAGCDWKACGWKLEYVDKADPDCAEFNEEHTRRMNEKKMNAKWRLAMLSRKGNRSSRKEKIARILEMIHERHSLTKFLTIGRLDENLASKVRRFKREVRIVEDNLGNEYPNLFTAGRKTHQVFQLNRAMMEDTEASMGLKPILLNGVEYKFKMNLEEEEKMVRQDIAELKERIKSIMGDEDDQEEID